MLRHRRFLLTMHRLALMGALLMAVAPVFSRWVQSQGRAEVAAQAVQAMCHGQATPITARPGMAHAGHMVPQSTGMSMPMDHGDGRQMPADHAGMACEYCVLAAQLLPFVLVLLLLPLLRPAVARCTSLLSLPRISAAWPAHAARGPPLHA